MICFFIVIAIISILSYFIFMLWQVSSWKINILVPENYQPSTKVSVIVPVRNESDNIYSLMNSLLKQNYPKELMEFIIVDDFSTDSTPEILNQFKFEFLHILKSNNPQNILHKKMAIESGILKSSGDLIITTDADCTHHPEWVLNFVYAYENHQPSILFGPVQFLDNGMFLTSLQIFELSSLMLVTNASIQSNCAFMGNASNMAYPKNVFIETGGYKNDQINSGDDVSLLNKISKRYKKANVFFINHPHSLVLTKPVLSFNDLIQQRVRWASKSIKSPVFISTLIASIIAMYYMILCMFLIFGIFNFIYFILFLCMFLHKLLFDYIIIMTFKKTRNFKLNFIHFVFGEIFYYAYYLLVLVKSVPGKYKWKGRDYKL